MLYYFYKVLLFIYFACVLKIACEWLPNAFKLWISHQLQPAMIKIALIRTLGWPLMLRHGFKVFVNEILLGNSLSALRMEKLKKAGPNRYNHIQRHVLHTRLSGDKTISYINEDSEAFVVMGWDAKRKKYLICIFFGFKPELTELFNCFDMQLANKTTEDKLEDCINLLKKRWEIILPPAMIKSLKQAESEKQASNSDTQEIIFSNHSSLKKYY